MMSNSFSLRLIFFSILIVFVTIFLNKLVFADFSNSNLDPVLQYNQSGTPYIVYGGTPSGDYNDLNFLGEGLTYDIEEQLNGNYRVEVWHNSSEIALGNLNFINVTINFTTNVSDVYSLQIYNWSASEWTSVGCDSGPVSAYTPTQWWCNMTENPTYYNSSDNIVRIRISSTSDSDAGLLKEDYVQYYVGYQPAYLEVEIINPDSSGLTNVVQNRTFYINVTITCRGGPCGEVFGTSMYNLSSENPDIAINITIGDKPFYIQESPANAKKSCGILYKDQSCQLNWTVNATGNINTYHKIGVLFNSSFPEIKQNFTQNSSINIIDCTVDFTIINKSVHFGDLNPGDTEKAAQGNENKKYNISVNYGSCNLDFYIKGTNLVNNTYKSLIGVDNVTWSNTTNDYESSFNLTNTNEAVKLNVPENMNMTLWYWINVPPVYAGIYNGTIYITGVRNGESP